MKADIEIVKMAVERNEPDQIKQQAILDDILEAVKIQQEENPAQPRQPKQFVMLVSDPDLIIKDDLVGWVVQTSEDDSPLETEDKIIKATYEFNQTPKGRRMPVKTIGEALEVIPSRIFRQHGIWPKTREPVLLVRPDNQIPQDNS